MPSRPNQGHAVPEGFCLTASRLDAWILAHHPPRVGSMQEDRRVEGPAPLDEGRVVVRMRDRDRTDAAEVAYRIDRGVVDHCDAVPKQVAFGRPDEQRALADRKRRFGADADQAHVVPQPVVMLLAQLIQGRPSQAAPTDVLPLVLADRAALGCISAGRELHATGGADVAPRRARHEVNVPRAGIEPSAVSYLRILWREHSNAYATASPEAPCRHGFWGGRLRGAARGRRATAADHAGPAFVCRDSDESSGERPAGGRNL